MDKATEMYKEIIDELANMSKDCADARGVKHPLDIVLCYYSHHK